MKIISISLFQDERIAGKDAKKMLYKDVTNNVKRLMGTKFNGPEMEANRTLVPATVVESNEGGSEIEVENYLGDAITRVKPEEVSAAILQQLKDMVFDHLGELPLKDVITVPAHFNYS